MNPISCARSIRVACSAVFALALTAQGAIAEEDTKPAVSGLNGKIAATGGVIQQTGVYFLDGSISFPVDHDLGIQIDGLAGVIDGDGAGGAGIHAFWRDPDIGLLGVYGSVLGTTAGTNYTVGNIGLEGAYYYEDFNFEMAAGGQFGINLDFEPFVSTNIAFYPIDDLRLYAGYRFWFDKHNAAGGLEWQFPGNDNSMAWSIFADGRANDENDVTATAGVRIYFGENKSLKRRHREDDPISLLPTDLSIILNQLAASNLPAGCLATNERGECIRCAPGYRLTFGPTLRRDVEGLEIYPYPTIGGQCVPFEPDIPTVMPVFPTTETATQDPNAG